MRALFLRGALALAAAMGLWVALTSCLALGQQYPTETKPLSSEKESRTPAQRKIDSHLLRAAQQHQGLPSPRGVPEMRSTIQVDGAGNTLVDIKAKVTDAVLARIRTLGGSVVSSFPQYDAIRASLPIDRLEELAATPEVSFIRPAEEPITNKISRP
jgi:hypothetical protein